MAPGKLHQRRQRRPRAAGVGREGRQPRGGLQRGRARPVDPRERVPARPGAVGDDVDAAPGAASVDDDAVAGRLRAAQEKGERGRGEECEGAGYTVAGAGASPLGSHLGGGGRRGWS